MSSRTRVRVGFYGVVAVALLALVTKAHALVLPAGLATQIGHNSEALLFALLVCASIEFVRPWARKVGRPWLVAAAGALVLWAAAWGLLQTGWTSSVVTLNEPIVGAGFLLLYITIPRPFRWWPIAFLAILTFIVVFFDTAFVLDQAESLVPFLIAPIALDAVDRTILQPDQPDRRTVRMVWVVVLAMIGLGFMALAPGARENLESGLNLAIDYGHRASEAYWGWMLVHVYFALVAVARRRERSAAVSR